MGCNLVLTVGNAMMGDDGAGPYLADKLQDAPLPGWIHIDGGIAPENVVYKVRELQPERPVRWSLRAPRPGLEPSRAHPRSRARRWTACGRRARA